LERMHVQACTMVYVHRIDRGIPPVYSKTKGGKAERKESSQPWNRKRQVRCCWETCE
jgi:hypothetical protein